MHSRFMRSGLLPLVALASLALVGASVAQPQSGQPGQPPRRSPQPGGGGGRGESGQSAEQAMKSMNGAARRLKDQIGDASKKDENLKLIWAMQKGAVQAKSMEPDHLGDGGDKAKLLPEYRKDLNKLLKELIKLEEEVTDGKSDAAARTFAAIVELRDAEHKKFKIKD